jgi:hypothetical protein
MLVSIPARPSGTPPITPPVPGPLSGPSAITGPLTIAELLDRTFRALRARFGLLMLSAAIVMVPLGLLTAIFTGRFMTGYFDLMQFALDSSATSPPAFEEFFGPFLGYLGGILLVSLLNVLGTTLVSLITIYHIHHFLHGASTTVQEGFRVALRRFLPTIWMQIVRIFVIGLVTAVILVMIGIVFTVIALIFGGAMSTLGNDTAGVIMVVGLVILFLVGYLIMIILMLAPSAYFTARWVAAAPILLIENLGPIQSLQRSWGLTKGRLWRCILYVVLLTLLSTLVIGLPLGLTQQIAMLVAPSQIMTIFVISTVSGYLLNLFYQPFFATGIVMLYYDLRVRAEAYDVTLRVAALEAELAQGVPVAPAI